MDELRSKWYSSLPCFRSPNEAYRPQPLGVSAVAGVFILLGFGILAGCLILILEHLVYKYALPGLRRQPKGTIWRSPNMMFFSQVRQPCVTPLQLLTRSATSPTPGRRGGDNTISSLIRSVELKRISPLVCLAHSLNSAAGGCAQLSAIQLSNTSPSKHFVIFHQQLKADDDSKCR
jgi:hypothetical protein